MTKLRDWFLIFLLGFIAARFIYKLKPNSEKHIDLPEEWNQVKQGDTLRVYKVTADTIYIGYYNIKNR